MLAPVDNLQAALYRFLFVIVFVITDRFASERNKSALGAYQEAPAFFYRIGDTVLNRYLQSFDIRYEFESDEG